ncbi:hypothetical protein QE419_000575 [Brevundimonas vesicularis]|uniref:DUF6766 family protein n=1 Tax=Brevundimonas vesicularis TaxID=41276 RepID=UPI0027814901|nr:DUF6766 family protein [Brevundimonas vesicularis]MDQ1191809.1 hypothetical protein [Brevundimonas vesicularis]
MLKKYAYAWITLAFFTVSIALHWGFGWLAYVDDQTSHGQAVRLSPYLVEMGRDTFENWQSEFLQLLWQVVGLAYFLYVGSPSSKENDERMEAKLDALIELVGKEKGAELIADLDKTHLRHSGHATIHKPQSY